MEFGLLGPLLVRRGGSELTVRRGRERALLVALLLQANRVVPAEAISDALWETEQPPSAGIAVRNYVRRLRQCLGDDRRERIATHPRGYLIRVADAELDLIRFEQLLARARAAARGGRWEQAVSEAARGLELWRGEPLADIESQLLASREVPRLGELRLQAVELRLEAQLQLDGHDEAAAELARLAAEHPLREHVHALLMLALYRCGRQADALAAYQNVRRVLVEELGAEPGTELRHLHRQILAADPALLPQPAGLGTPGGDGGVSLGPGQSRIDGGDGDGDRAGRATEVPRQLPAAVAHFTGRVAEMEALTQILDDQAGGDALGTVVISAIGGTAGVGKTALALHFAHHAASRFPDGQLYVNLRGFDPGGAPVASGEAIRGFLDALGVAAERMPSASDAQEGLYRSLLAGQRMLIVLDNAADEQQVRPLIPASPASLVIITSRRQLAGLAASGGARLLTLDLLSHDETIQMLATRIGTARAAAEPDAVAEIAGLCGRLPLALAVAAARAAAHPGLSLADLAAELRDTSGRLDALDAGDPAASVTAVFSWSTRQLSFETARLFRLLGLHPGPDITAPAAASLAGCSPTRARRLLAELAHAHLISEHSPGRYAFHDLLRGFAASQARCTDSEADRHAAVGRVLDHYLHTAHAAGRVIYPGSALALASPRPGVAPENLASYEQAMAWFEAEHHVLIGAITLAADNGYDIHAWQIPWALTNFLSRRGHWHQWAAIQRTAVAAATRVGDAAGQAESYRLLASACSRLGDQNQTRAHLSACLELYRQLGDHVGEAKAHHTFSALAERQSRYADALGHAEQALRLYQAAGHQMGQAEAFNSAGWFHAWLGHYDQARVFCQRSVTLSSEIGHRENEAAAWDSLGYAEHRGGNLPEAAACYQRALSLFRELGIRFDEAETLTRLGDTYQAAGDLGRAGRSWHQALGILDELRHPDAEHLRAKLAAGRSARPVDHHSSRPAAAVSSG